MHRLCFMLAVAVLMFGSGSAFAQDGPPATWTFSIWHWLIVLVALTVRVLGMWTAWSRSVKYATYVQIFIGLFVVSGVVSIIGHADFKSPWVLIAALPLPVIWFVWPHLTVRRLNTVGWRLARWVVIIPGVNQLLGLVLVFVKAPEAEGKE